MLMRKSALALTLLLAMAASAVVSDPTVYVTKTGEKYHQGWCRYLSKSKIAIKLSEAKKRYSPCSVCDPPKIAD